MLATATVALAAADDPSNGGVIAWQNPTFAAACHSASASARVPQFSGGLTHFLRIANYGFPGLPDDAIVLGIVLSVTKDRFGYGTATDARVSLVDENGDVTSENKTQPGNWPAPGLVSYGALDDPWGRAWTGANLKSPQFGWVIAADTTHDNRFFNDFYAYVGCPRLEVCYTLPTAAP